MSQIFPQWTNKIPILIAGGAVVLVLSVIGFFWYYGSPKYTDVGYRPTQPVAYSHKVHAGDLGVDCRYCHCEVERAAMANVPPTQTCMNCHKLVTPSTEKMQKVQESWVSGRPIQWVRVHNLPDFAYFNHGAHLRVGVGCASCHGSIAQMEVVTQMQPLSMSWCLDCHRNPDAHLRPVDQITNMSWTPPADQAEFAKRMKAEKKINPPTDCSGCHR